MTPPLTTYRAASSMAALLDRTGRARIEVTGRDRAKFLHNLTTNDVKRLGISRGQEAFVTSPQGKTLGYVTLLAADDRIVLCTDAGGLSHILPHFQKYGVFDDVGLDDLSERTFDLHLAGPLANAILRGAGGEPPDEDDLAHRLTRVGDVEVRVVRESPTGHAGLTLAGRREDAAPVLAALRDAGTSLGMSDLHADVYEALRIEAGMPVFGRDVTAENLPQEVARDARAINFVKGCYLGQETVARIDAIGHVNKLLRGLRFVGTEVPAPGTAIEAGGKPVGTITSAAFSPGRACAVALGYVRMSHAAAGTEVFVASGAARMSAIVSELPMPPG